MLIRDCILCFRLIMIDISLGSKRRLSDADKNERITLRQMVLNMSICKLQKHMGRKEPSLLRSVMINNTVQQIEREMDLEMLADYDHSYDHHHQLGHNKEINADTFFSPKHSSPKNNTEKQFTSNIVESNSKKENKFGAIGDHRKGLSPDLIISNKPAPYLSGFMWDAVSFSPLHGNEPHFDTLELGNNFNDVDISLYDFDNNFINNNAQNSAGDWRLFPKSCAAEFESHKSDSFFEELDQIMQFLVGM